MSTREIYINTGLNLNQVTKITYYFLTQFTVPIFHIYIYV